MDSVILLGLRIGLLVVLWLFILMALGALRKDTKIIANSGNSAFSAGASAVPAPAKSRITSGTPRSLTVVEGPLLGARLDISASNEITIGRAAECTFTIGDDYASSRHAKLIRRGNEWFIEDLDSRNGTFVSGYRIEQPEKVGVGVDIKIGRTVVRLVP
ncbi:FHA domain-containing protein [Corynebacterium sp. sy017]|uniref:FHA domain-containing protein FhaB/FipA n=1 Tax=unclassified Corynebacterium TaxID=2624378 RepID=UPI001185CC74|nr:MULTISPECIES: FHA domain-containing protein [unclassified Corynebacterium]MBP3088307.1 FHA domain-containing protein [Corynebacterium sp. sy017]QDZ41764.1 FHA domain-containing protein [Corynebacterium sp. sy039]TSD91631.1 FHA domain-containing protein [Corynebacterium sp. SY003]